MVTGLLEFVAPRRLGPDFRRLVASSWTSNIGDGIALAAGPLLVASQTHSPFLVSMALFLQGLPSLLFGLFAGALADRMDRRRIVIVANLVWAVVLVGLCATIVTGIVDVAIVLGAMFLIGTTEVFADSAYRTFLPMLVQPGDLGIANSRLQIGFITLNELAGAPIGAALFAIGMALPFAIQVACGLLAVVFVSRLGLPPGGVREVESHIVRDIADGVRWLVTHPPIRTLALVIAAFNVTWAAGWSVLVIYSLDVLHMGAIGYGLLTTIAAGGGVIATLCYGWLERRIALSVLMRACLICEVFLHLGLALTTSKWVAMVLMLGFGLYAFVWGTLSNVVRQRAVPREFQGRVGSVYVVGLHLGVVVGSALGGVIATRWGITAPFWFAFVGSGLTLAVMWRSLTQIAHADAAQAIA